VRDAFRPRLSRWAAPPRLLAFIGWGLALAALAAGAGGALHPLGARTAAAVASPAASLAKSAAEAAEHMRRAERFLHDERLRRGILADRDALPDWSGLLGAEVTPLMTTLGTLEAKRIATNPEWARVLTIRLAGAGVARGDIVAAGFSGSFPGLNLAIIEACGALGADIVAVSSVTASTWGANQPGFTWPEIEAALVEARLIRRASIAVTAGGDADRALDLEPEGRALACRVRDAAARRLGVPVIDPSDFHDAVRRRLAAYRRAANGRPLALYANIGGADASLGRSAAILRHRSGFLPAAPFGRPGDQGVTARMAADGVPVLLLLNVRDLALRWGVPLAGPRPGR
jgi:poly-gamma-glutamate system protein